jgi:hypothetical protein
VCSSDLTSKPYRHIPIFDASQLPVLPGATIEQVNLARLSLRPLEQLPTSRKRYALALSIAHRLQSSPIRASERIYADNWGVTASTTDARYMIDVTKPLRVWPHFRFHAQSRASFYKIAYTTEVNTDGQDVLPAIRTGDRELGPMFAMTLGAGARYALGEKRRWGLRFTGDVVYTEFLEHLFVENRWGFFGALGLEVDLE